MPHTRTSTTALIGVAVLLAGTFAVSGTVQAKDATSGKQAADRKSAAELHIQPLYAGDAPATPPAVTPAVTCIRKRAGGEREVVFGYTNQLVVSTFAPLDPDMGGVNTVSGGSSGQHARPTQFLPGTEPYAFAVVYEGRTPTWTISSPSTGDPDFGGLWSVSVTAKKAPACGPEVPTKFANIQSGSLAFGPDDVVIENGTVVDYTFAVAARALPVCSGGPATGAVADVVYGWGVTENLEPFDDVLREPTSGQAGPFAVTWTRQSKLHVVDAQQMSSVSVLFADVYGRCSYADGSVVDSPVFYLDQLGEVTVEVCPSGADIPLCVGAVLPGGIRVR